MTELKTFVFEAHYPEDDGGTRCDVVLAPDRDTARRLAAVQALTDNSWTLAGQGCPDLLTFYDGSMFEDGAKMDVEAEWGDLAGTACPNCTSHAGRPNGDHLEIDGAERLKHLCTACGYIWFPMGFDPVIRPQLEAATLGTIAELDEIERNLLVEADDEA